MNCQTLILKGLIGAAGVMMLSSCDSLYDKLQPCPEVEPPMARINLTFTQNMEFEDLFGDQVHCIDLYLFNHGGNLVYEHHQESETKSTRSVDNQISLSLEPGYYDIMVYGGMFCTQSSFKMAYDINEDIRIKDLEVTLDQSFYFDDSDDTGDATEHIDDHSVLEMHDYFFGSQENFYVDESGLTTLTIDLERNTNRINVKLYNSDNSNIDVNDYRLYIIDDNNTFNSQNELTESGLIAYRPYSKENIEEDNIPKASSSFTVSKLYKNDSYQFGEITPQLVVIDKEIGEESPVVDHQDLMPYLLAAKDAYSNGTSMTDDEFLRRNYEWTIELVIDKENNSWISLTVKIDDWEVRFNNAEFAD